MTDHLSRDDGLTADPVAMARKGKPTRKTVIQRTVERVRREGSLAGTVARWVPNPGMRLRLFGIADVFGIRAGKSTLYRACSVAKLAEVVRSICEDPRTGTVLGARLSLEVWAWSVPDEGENGKRPRWVVQREAITGDDLEPVTADEATG